MDIVGKVMLVIKLLDDIELEIFWMVYEDFLILGFVVFVIFCFFILIVV